MRLYFKIEYPYPEDIKLCNVIISLTPFEGDCCYLNLNSITPICKVECDYHERPWVKSIISNIETRKNISSNKKVKKVRIGISTENMYINGCTSDMNLKVPITTYFSPYDKFSDYFIELDKNTQLIIKRVDCDGSDSEPWEVFYTIYDECGEIKLYNGVSKDLSYYNPETDKFYEDDFKFRLKGKKLLHGTKCQRYKEGKKDGKPFFKERLFC